jgi:mRNA interferase RelE/StbE
LPYASIFTKSFKKEFRKLHKDIQETVLKTLEKTVDNPHTGKRLEGKLEGLWRYRVGKYRIIYLIDEEESNVVFLDVGLRKSIYG